MLIFCLLLGALFSWFISQGITVPLIAITDTFKRLSEGQTNITIPEQDRIDEIGVLSQAADVFRKKSVQLEKSNHELIQFSYRTSHDLKAPLVTTKRLSRFIVQDIDDGNLEEARKNSLQIVKQMENLENLVVDILELAKADTDAEDSEYKTINLDNIFLEITERLSWLIEESGCQLNKTTQISNEIIGNKARFSQIIENLISNGIKYRDDNKKCSFVNVKFYEDNEDLVIFVEDNGLGIPKQNVGDLFKMFKRFHPKSASGSGLGMSLVKKHIDFMNGDIDVESSSEGTQFKVKIPKPRRHS